MDGKWSYTYDQVNAIRKFETKESPNYSENPKSLFFGEFKVAIRPGFYLANGSEHWNDDRIAYSYTIKDTCSEAGSIGFVSGGDA